VATVAQVVGVVVQTALQLLVQEHQVKAMLAELVLVQA
jgi:hypothetical protein